MNDWELGNTRISGGEDILDSRDIIDRIAYLRGLDENGEADWAEIDELAGLLAVEEELGGYGDWKYGMTLIRSSYFVAYAQELAMDIGAIESDMRWPCNWIDWENAAENLKADYVTADVFGTTYYAR